MALDKRRRKTPLPVTDLARLKGVFDPSQIADDECIEGHFDVDAVHSVLLVLGKQEATGRLSVADAAGDNHMYFMKGRPVGVQLAERAHPLGQLLLELGRVDGATFLAAQRLIAQGGRLPGQVFKELNVVDEHSLKEVLAVQARRKAEHFCRLGNRPFSFRKGLMSLTGFTATPLDPHAVVFLAIRQQTGPQAREAWLDAARQEQVRVVRPDDAGAVVEHLGLPAPLASYGFGPSEERFLSRIVAGFESVVDLAETGTLPRDEMAVLLRYLEVIGRLQRRPVPPARPASAQTVPSASPSYGQPKLDAAFAAFSGAVRSESTTPARGTLERRPIMLSDASAPDKGATLDANKAGDAGAGAAARPSPTAAKAFTSAAPTKPSSTTHGVESISVFVEGGDVFAPTAPAPAGSPNPALEEPTPPLLPPPPEHDVVAPVVRKKKVKRSEPLPSSLSALSVSETRRERTMITPLPSIVIEDD
jgi:hypothetical protein